MPQLASVVLLASGSYLGAVALGAAAFSWGALGLAAGLGLVSYLLAPKPPELGTGRADTRHNITAAVSPARWIWGRARVGGVLVFYREINKNDLHLVLLLSEGACDSIERVWIEGDEIPITRTARTGTDESGHLIQPAADDRHHGRIWIYEYFAADGTQGDSLRDAAGPREGEEDEEMVWTDGHDVNGISWVHVHLFQPDYGRSIDLRFWSRLPSLEFLVKGIKFTWPGQSTAAWTDNAAALRYFWLTERRGIPSAAIDTASFTAAYTLCNQEVIVMLPEDYQDYSDSSKRYAVNGVVYSDDEPERVEAELDFAWQGWAVEIGGIYHFRPGADRVVTRAITPDDIIAIEGIQPAPALQDRMNAATIALAQSREHDWLEVSLDELGDSAAQTRDGERLPKDLGTRPFIADPIAGGRLLAIQLRRARASATYSYRLKPGANMEWLAIVPSDWLTVTDPEHGLEDFQVVVTRTLVHEDWSVTLDLIEQPDGVYDDTLVLPPLKSRRIRLSRPQDVPAVTGLTVSHGFVVSRDGTVVWHLDVTWDDSPYYTRLRVTDEDENLQTEARADGTSQRFTVDGPSTYTVTAYHVTLQGFASPAVSLEITFDWTGVPMPVPVIIASEQYGTFLQIVAQPIINRDVAGIEVRYTRGAIDGMQDLDAIDDAGWLTAMRADVAFVAPISGNQPLVANVLIPATGRYRLFCRLFNHVGNFGPIAEIGYKRLVIPAIETISPQQWPLWTGVLNNLFLWPHDDQYRLVPDYGNRDALTIDQLDGREGWPFGPVSGYAAALSDMDSTYYETEIIDLGEESNVDVIINIESFAPPDPYQGFTGTVETNTATVEYIYQATAANASPGTPTGGADTDSFVPSGWSGAAITPASDLRYVWRSTRTQSGGTWTDNDFAAPELWSVGEITPQTGHDVYAYHWLTGNRPATPPAGQPVLISGQTRINAVRYLVFRVHLRQWHGAALTRFVPQIRRLA